MKCPSSDMAGTTDNTSGNAENSVSSANANRAVQQDQRQNDKRMENINTQNTSHGQLHGQSHGQLHVQLHGSSHDTDTSADAGAFNIKEAERLLEQAERGLDKEREIERILNAFKLNAYDVLGVRPGIAPDQIRRMYRSKSLQLHPDRNPGNERAAAAFDRLKKAQDELLDDNARELLDSAWVDARNMLIREQKISRDDSERLMSSEFVADLLVRWCEVLVQDELRRRKKRQIALAEEGRQRAKAEADEEQKREEAKHKEQWEATRDERVAGWRVYASNGKRRPNDDQQVKAPATAGSKKKKIRMLG